MAPEVLNKTGHNQSADIWSTGCFLLELLTGKPPYFDPKLAYEEVLKKIMRKEKPAYPALSYECRRFLNSCLEGDPSLRPTAQQLLADVWMRISCYQ